MDEDVYVIGPKGERYGPANLLTLQEWIRDGRLRPNDMVMSANSGRRMKAVDLPGLNFPPGMLSAPEVPDVRASASGPRTVEGVRVLPLDESKYEISHDLANRFNWGAFTLTWIWGLNHKQPVTLVALPLHLLAFVGPVIPRVGNLVSILALIGSVLVSIWFGREGYSWAWESGRYTTGDECDRAQLKWGWWGLAVSLCTCLGMLIIQFLFWAAILAQLQNLQPPTE